LVEVHFHVPAEHLVDGKRYPMEMHAVTKDDPVSTKAAKVFGVLFSPDDAAPDALRTLLDQFGPAQPGKVCAREPVGGAVLDLDPLLPKRSAFFAYDGSLTTPKCDEIVTFYIAEQPVRVSRSELGRFVDLVGVGSTARKPQALGGRKIRYIK